MNQRAIEKTELNKILSAVADFAVTEGGKQRVVTLQPTAVVKEVVSSLKLTEE